MCLGRPAATDRGLGDKTQAGVAHLRGQHQRHHLGAGAALGRDGYRSRPHRTLPALGPLGCGFDHLGGFREKVQRFSLQAGGQAGHRHVQDVPGDGDAAGVGEWLGLRLETGLKCRAVNGGGAFDRQAQHKFTLLRHTFQFAHQPAGLQLDVQRRAQDRGFEVGRDCQGHWQQHRVFKTVVGQVADWQFFGRGPGNISRQHARGQGPAQGRGLAGIARVFPVGVPMRLVAELQTDPDGFTRVNTIGGVRHQLGAHLFGDDRVF